jgi:hypothetical protein
MMHRYVTLFAACLFAASVCAGEDINSQMKDLQAQVERLAQTVNSQGKTIEAQQKTIDEQSQMLKTVKNVNGPIARDAVGDLFKRVERAEQQSAQALKVTSERLPLDLRIGGAIDTSFGIFDGLKQDAAEANNRAAGADFAIRGAELIFYTDVDPYFKTYMVLNATPDPTANDEAVPLLEEAAILTTSLSYAQVKGGRFFMPFGRFSMIHDHDLPFTTRPPSIDNYVGGESAGDGIQVQALVPIDHFLQFTGGAFNKLGANFPLVNTVGDRRDISELTYFAKALTSFDLGDSHTFELGASTAQVPNNEHRRDLTDIEFTYKYHPLGSPLRQRLIWGTELLRNHLRTEVDSTDSPPVMHFPIKRGYGGYSYVEWFLTRHWSVGPRVDLFENVLPTAISKRTYEQTYSAFVTYLFSEFGRLRFEYDRRYFFDGNKADEAFLQWTVFFGAHKHNFDQR